MPAAGLYKKMPGTEDVAFNSVPLKAMPKMISAGLAQVMMGVALLTFMETDVPDTLL